jgi:signal transduction histidine kinase/ligand-binding sensor domain-containing protein
VLLKLTTLNSDSGLPNEQVHAIDQDSFGRLWLASPTGLARYNGSQVKIFDHTNGLSCIGLRTVRVSSDGTVWIGTDQGIEAINIDGTPKKWNIRPEWNFGIAESILIADNTIWAGTSFGLLKLYDNTEKNELQLLHKEDLGLVRCILKNGSNLLVASAKYGLLNYNTTGWQHFNKEDLPSGDSIICMAHTNNNLIMVGTTTGLFLLDPSGKLIEHFTLPDSNNKVTALAASGNQWWIGIGHSLVLASYNNNGITVMESIKINSTVNEIFIDQADNVWIATNNLGLKKITCIRQALKQVKCGLGGSGFSIKKITGTNQLHIGGDGFFSTIGVEKDENEIHSETKFTPVPSIVWDSCIDPADKSLTWIATDDGLYFSKNNNSPKKFNDNENLLTSPNRVLLIRGTEIWLGTIGGLYKIQDGIVQEILAIDGSHFGYVYTLSLDNDNRIWVGTLGKGLWIETTKGLAPVVNDLLNPLGNTYSIVTHTSGKTIVIQEDKLLITDKNLHFNLIITENPIAGWSAVWINETIIATGGNNGLLLIDIETAKIVQRINPILGKSAWQFTSTRSLYYDGEENIYCAINSGLFVANIKKFEKFLVPPPIYLEQVDWNNVSPITAGNNYTIKPGKWSVNVTVFTNWLIDEDKIRFRFKLVGFDETWTELATTPSIRYNSLPAGQYDLQCQLYTPLTGFTAMAELIHINVSNSFYKFGLTPVANMLTAVNEKFFKPPLRNKLLREKNVELELEINERRQTENALLKSREDLRQLTFHQEKIREEERLRLSREVHDELGQLLTGIKMGISWLKKKSILSEQKLEEKFDETLELVDETTRTVRRIATELRPGVLDSFGIVAALEWQAVEFEKRTAIKLQFYTNCAELKLDEEKSIVLFRIFQETLTNVARYAEASMVIASLEIENETLLMKIRDNGKGFAITEIKNKNTLGILGMQERALMIGAEYNISSSPGKGTAIDVKISGVNNM